MSGQINTQKSVFLSHASANKRWVDILARNLKAQGYKLFYGNWSLTPGGDLVSGIYESMESTDAGILVASPEAANSGWVGREFEQMMVRKARDPKFIVIPVVYGDYGDIAKFPFLDTLLQVDFRPTTHYREAFYRLLCGLERREPGSEQRFSGDLEIPSEETFMPLDTDARNFLDKLLAGLTNTRLLVLLAQAGRGGGSVLSELLAGAKNFYDSKNVLHLTPLFDPSVSRKTYFRDLGQQCGFGESIEDANGLQMQLDRRLRANNAPLFLLVSGFENGCTEGRTLLAGALRALHDSFAHLHVVFSGGERLVELKYAHGAVSMLYGAGLRE